MKDDEKEKLIRSCSDLEEELKKLGVKVKGDYRDNYSPGWKFNHWELKGVPIRVEVGPKDVAQDQIVAVRRDSGEKITIKRPDAALEIKELATKDLDDHKVICCEWNDFCKQLDEKKIILALFCGEIPCEELIKKESAREDIADSGAPAMGAKGLCIPFDQPQSIQENDKCIHPRCQNKPKYYVLFGRSY
ncbi:hypothetical protein J437_LFUL015627 [Ladona fulva]|uniref:proline--tRNA ligase n=1 Tax=Ladona fulva TaxID=123851 RepID=A0A8K0P905_LADFU|nr:hypothetical protein J437_LFUL015627 [Ladona fulva]